MSSCLNQFWMVDVIPDLDGTENIQSCIVNKKEKSRVDPPFIVCEILGDNTKKIFVCFSYKEFSGRSGYFMISPFSYHLDALILMRFIGKFQFEHMLMDEILISPFFIFLHFSLECFIETRNSGGFDQEKKCDEYITCLIFEIFWAKRIDFLLRKRTFCEFSHFRCKFTHLFRKTRECREGMFYLRERFFDREFWCCIMNMINISHELVPHGF